MGVGGWGGGGGGNGKPTAFIKPDIISVAGHMVISAVAAKKKFSNL